MEGHPGPILNVLNTNVYENLAKNIVLTKHHGIIMMSQANAPIHRHKTSLIYFPVFFNMSNLNFNFYLLSPGGSYNDLDQILEPGFNQDFNHSSEVFPEAYKI